jgi:hypothetical protein
VAAFSLCGAIALPDFDFDGAEVEGDDRPVWAAGVFGDDDSAGAYARLNRSLLTSSREDLVVRDLVVGFDGACRPANNQFPEDEE